MGSFTRLAVLLLLGAVSLGGITAEKASKMVALKDAIKSISDAKVKEEINNLIANHDMDGAESKMMKYIFDYATKMTPENQSEKDEVEDDVVKAMKFIQEGFNDLKNNAASEFLDEVIYVMAPNGTKSNRTKGMPPSRPRKSGPMNQVDAKMMVEIIEKFPNAAAKATIINDLEAYDFAKAEMHMLNALGDMVPNINDEVRVQVHEGMVALKAAAEQYAKEQEVPSEEDELIETLEKIKADQEKIEELLKELDSKN